MAHIDHYVFCKPSHCLRQGFRRYYPTCLLVWSHFCAVCQVSIANKDRKVEYLEATLASASEKAEALEERLWSAEQSLAARDAALAESTAALEEVCLPFCHFGLVANKECRAMQKCPLSRPLPQWWHPKNLMALCIVQARAKMTDKTAELAKSLAQAQSLEEALGRARRDSETAVAALSKKLQEAKVLTHTLSLTHKLHTSLSE